MATFNSHIVLLKKQWLMLQKVQQLKNMNLLKNVVLFDLGLKCELSREISQFSVVTQGVSSV